MWPDGGQSILWCCRSTRSDAGVGLVALDELPYGIRLRAVGDEQVAAAAARGLEHVGLVGRARRHVREEHHQLEAVHVGPQRPWGVPADPRQPQEGARRLHLRADRTQHLLLACRTVAVVLGGSAAVLPDTGIAE